MLLNLDLVPFSPGPRPIAVKESNHAVAASTLDQLQEAFNGESNPRHRPGFRSAGRRGRIRAGSQPLCATPPPCFVCNVCGFTVASRNFLRCLVCGHSKTDYIAVE